MMTTVAREGAAARLSVPRARAGTTAVAVVTVMHEKARRNSAARPTRQPMYASSATSAHPCTTLTRTPLHHIDAHQAAAREVDAARGHARERRRRAARARGGEGGGGGALEHRELLSGVLAVKVRELAAPREQDEETRRPLVGPPAPALVQPAYRRVAGWWVAGHGSARSPDQLDSSSTCRDVAPLLPCTS